MNRGARHVAQATRRGFTLLEIVIVLSIIAAIAGLAFLSFGTVETEQRLRESVGTIESFAKRARNIAVVQQRPYQLTISQEAISIAPQYVREDDGSSNEDESALGDQVRFKDVTDREATDQEVTYEVKRWGSDAWQLIEKDKKVLLTIDPTGLVEPISIRCSLGESWIVQELHPLTAGVRNEEMSIENE